MFQDSDKRHADLRIRLRHDGLTQVQFFRGMVSGYLESDPRIIDFITGLKIELAKQGKNKIKKTSNLIKSGEENKRLFSFSKEEEEDLFDMIAKEFPDL